MSFVFLQKGESMNRYLKKLLLWTAAFLIGLNLLGFAKLNILAKEPDTPSYTRYYKSILIHKGDSLWKIAEQYCPDGAMSVGNYMEELKQINQLKEDTIHSGCYLTIVYFEPEDS